METQIQAHGWEQSHRRQPGLSANDDEARALALRNGGELGLWRTTAALLEAWLAEQPAPGDVLHVSRTTRSCNPSCLR